jgi:hypothetical protein
MPEDKNIVSNELEPTEAEHNAEPAVVPAAAPGQASRAVKGAASHRGLRYGGFSLAITVSFIVVIVLLNAVVTTLGERYSLRLDLTQDQIFQLSTPSLRFLASLDKDVKLYILTSEDYFATGNLYSSQAQEVIRQYAARSPHITLEYVDLPKAPGFETRFPQFSLSSYTIILESGGRASTIMINDLFNTDFDMYYYTEYITSSKAEQVLTSAIMGITMDQQVTVAILEGFGESGSDTLENILVTNNYNPVRQNILTEEVNPDAEFAIICAPLRDYTEDELRKLDRYLQNGGDYGRTLLYFPSVVQPPTPNIHAFLADWGIAVFDGIVYQTDNAKLVTMSNYWSIADYNEDRFAKPVIERRLVAVVPEARPLGLLYESKESRTVSAPLAFGSTAVAAPLMFGEEWSPEVAEYRGPMPAMAIGSESAFSRNLMKESVSNVLVFGSIEFIGPTLLTRRTVGNLDYILNVFAVLSDREESGYIVPKTIGAQELPVTGQNVIVLGILFIAVLPLCVLITGSVVYFMRRHL